MVHYIFEGCTYASLLTLSLLCAEQSVVGDLLPNLATESGVLEESESK